MASKICVPIDVEMYAEFILRAGESVDVTGFIESIVQDYLDRTEGDPDIWSDAHAKSVSAQLDKDFEGTYGDPNGFYQWDSLFLMNGTQLRMRYKGKNYFAVIRDEEIVFEEHAYTPSQLASKIAGGTSRNAWRDLWIKERGSSQWVLADDLRRRPRVSARLEDF